MASSRGPASDASGVSGAAVSVPLLTQEVAASPSKRRRRITSPGGWKPPADVAIFGAKNDYIRRSVREADERNEVNAACGARNTLCGAFAFPRRGSRLRRPRMKLVLDDGAIYEGEPFGAEGSAAGEVVFNTGLTGYVETLTDPSYKGQILVLTYPLQGNYGVPEGPFESARIQVQGLVVQHHSLRPSHRSSTRTLDQWLRESGVPAITGIDTRALTRRLREHGTMQGHIGAACESIEMRRVAEIVTPNEIVRYDGGDVRVLLVDTGVKESIIRSLQRRGVTVVRAPFFAPWESLVSEVDGVLFGNGPGDPTDLMPLVDRIKTSVLAKSVTTFGICLGHQLLCLAAGARTYKLPYGHRSQNQPVQELGTRRAYVTSQNHGYAVDDATLPRDLEPWFTNLNDGTNEGVRHRTRAVRSVQFHPEGAAGPRDTSYLFDEFVRMVTETRRTRSDAIERLAQIT
jgi:carbamoyl-phosphate synthase small subunit